MYLYLYLKNLLHSEEGQDLIEYALIIVLIIVAAIIGMATVGTRIADIWTDIAGHLVAAT